MRNILKTVFKNKIFIAILLMIIVFTPQSFYLQEINKLREIVTCIGIDKREDGVEMSILHIVPKGSSASGQNVEIATAKGESMADVLNKISLNLGKIISFAHCDVVLIADKILEEGLPKYLDFLMRKNNLTTSALVVGCDDAKKTLETIKSSKILAAQSLRELIEYNNKFIFTGESSVENFYQAYFNESGISFIPSVSVSEKGGSAESSGKSSGSGNEGSANSSSGSEGSFSSGGQEASGSSGGGNQDIANDGETIILKRGRKVLELSKPAIQLFNILSKDVNVSNLVAKDFIDGDGEVKTISTETSSKKIDRNIYFIDGKPIVHYDIRLVLSVDEISAEIYEEKDLDRAEPPISKEAKMALEKEFEKLFNQTVSLSKKEGLDLFRVEKYFDRILRKNWREYVSNNPENPFQNIIYSYDLKIVTK